MVMPSLTPNHDASRDSIHEYIRNFYRGHMQAEEIYVRNGDVYVHLVPVSSDPLNPPDTAIYRWEEHERDVDGFAQRTASLMEVCFLNGMTTAEDWIDEKAEKDHEGWKR